MNLNSAVFDNVLAIDERLRQLELEVEQMDNIYAVKPPSIIPSYNPLAIPEYEPSLPNVSFRSLITSVLFYSISKRRV
jgi:hypothetical protein